LLQRKIKESKEKEKEKSGESWNVDYKVKKRVGANKKIKDFEEAKREGKSTKAQRHVTLMKPKKIKKKQKKKKRQNRKDDFLSYL
jgi:hypothetical protein